MVRKLILPSALILSLAAPAALTAAAAAPAVPGALQTVEQRWSGQLSSGLPSSGQLSSGLLASGQRPVEQRSVQAHPAGPRPAGQQARLTLPSPTGPHELGTVSLHLVDTSRPDPWVTTVPHRELMVSVVYPAVQAGRYPLAPQLDPGTAVAFDTFTGNRNYGIPVGTVDWGATLTHAHRGAPADTRGGPLPVVLYSPGGGDPRSWDTTLVEDLASRGYVVVTIDHTYESPAVRFPDDSVRTTVLTDELIQKTIRDGGMQALAQKTIDTRVADTRFVLDRLATPGTFPPDLAKLADLNRIGMFGHSAGGYTAAETMHDDKRIKAGVNMDGPLGTNLDDGGPNLAPVAVDGLDRPFLLMGSQASDHYTFRSWEAFWDNTPGWHRDLHLRGTKHGSYTDAEQLLPQIAQQTGLSADALQAEIGWSSPGPVLTAQQTYLAGFFDRWLKHRDAGLFDRPATSPGSFIP
ncbi:alpha/beta hydrolase family protein [Kitasatospora sp. NPDC001175]|uniref:alpha/beta hydrolase family protein n=1 Tax=Kitasatospora sp. NPDC001175 TaxID=3157103 RepID=UPI003D08EDF4